MSKHISRRFGPITVEELLYLVVGKRLGYGQFREVFECPLSSDLVVKVSHEQGNVSNVLEWQITATVPFSRW